MKFNNKIISKNIDDIIICNKRLNEDSVKYMITLEQGWNLVAGSLLSSCEIKDSNEILEYDGDNYMIYSFIDGIYQNDKIFKKGVGYWIRSKKNGEIELNEK